MKLFGDYHTHTIFSHGTGTIEENVKVAVKKGLKEIAITDHGFEHKLYGVKRTDVSVMRKQIEELKKQYNINILFGMETNLISAEGDIDLTKEEEAMLDVILMGYHKIITAKSLKDRFSFFLMNNICKLFSPKRQIQKNTDAYLKAMDKYDIDILTHLKYGMPVDVIQIAKKAKEKNVLIELNGKRTLFTREEVEKMVEMKTKFIINSDAHKPDNVGECNHPMNFALMHHIPQELIVNLNELPKFKHRKDNGNI